MSHRMEIGRPERSHDDQCKVLESSVAHLVFLLSRSIKKRSLPRASTAPLPLLPPPPLWSLATSLSIAQVAAASIAMAVQPSMETQAPGNSSPPKVLPSAWFQFFNFVMIDVCTTMLHAAFFSSLFFFFSWKKCIFHPLSTVKCDFHPLCFNWCKSSLN